MPSPEAIYTDMVASVPKDVLARIEAQIPIGRLGQLDEIARLVEFLVSDEAGFITASAIDRLDFVRLGGYRVRYAESCAETTARGVRLRTAHPDQRISFMKTSSGPGSI